MPSGASNTTAAESVSRSQPFVCAIPPVKKESLNMKVRIKSESVGLFKPEP